MNKNTLVWVGGSLVLLAGIGIAVKMIFHPSEKKIVKELFEILIKKYPNTNWESFKEQVTKNEYKFNFLRLKALKNDEETFVFNQITYNSETLKRV